MESRDPLTGNFYKNEHAMYMRYHNLTEEQATAIMKCTTHASRDLAFETFINQQKANLQ